MSLDSKTIDLMVRRIEFESITEEPFFEVMRAWGASLAGTEPPDPLKGRVVKLSCGHLHFTKAIDRARCPRCQEMLRRSLTDGSADYDGFRHLGLCDTMEWENDPLRYLHESHYALTCEITKEMARRDSGEITQEQLSSRLIELERKSR